MRRGRIPDDVYREIEKNSRFTYTYCDRCSKEVKTTVENPRKEGEYICSGCEADILCQRAKVNLDETASED